MRRLTPFISELIRRRVPAFLALYIGGALAVLGAIDDLSEGLAWPPEVFDSVLVALSIGLINAFVAAWHHGARSAQRWSRREVGLHLVAVAAVAIVIVAMFTGGAQEVKPTDSGILALVPFEAGTGPMVQFLADSLRIQLAEGLRGQSGFRLAYSAEQNNAGRIVTGTVYRFGDDIRITVQMSDVPTGLQLWTARFVNNSDSILAALPNIVSSVCDSVCQNMTVTPE